MLLWFGLVSAYFQCPKSNPKAAHGHSRKALVSSVRLLMQEEEPKTKSLESFLNKFVVQTSKAVQESARATESAVNDYVNSGWQVKKRGAQRLHWDVSYKVEKHVAQYHGKPLYKGLLTATNEVGEARSSLEPYKPY